MAVEGSDTGSSAWVRHRDLPETSPCDLETHLWVWAGSPGLSRASAGPPPQAHCHPPDPGDVLLHPPNEFLGGHAHQAVTPLVHLRRYGGVQVLAGSEPSQCVRQFRWGCVVPRDLPGVRDSCLEGVPEGLEGVGLQGSSLVGTCLSSLTITSGIMLLIRLSAPPPMTLKSNDHSVQALPAACQICVVGAPAVPWCGRVNGVVPAPVPLGVLGEHDPLQHGPRGRGVHVLSLLFKLLPG